MVDKKEYVCKQCGKDLGHLGLRNPDPGLTATWDFWGETYWCNPCWDKIPADKQMKYLDYGYEPDYSEGETIGEFLGRYVLENGPATFKKEPWYNDLGDSIEYHVIDEGYYSQVVDDHLTVYKSAIDDRIIGFQITGASAFMKKLGISESLKKSP